MCRYYRHVWACGHVKMIFADHCAEGTRYQRPCKERTVWQTIDMDGDCAPCGGDGMKLCPSHLYYPSRTYADYCGMGS
jgi:hypothetical protein